MPPPRRPVGTANVQPQTQTNHSTIAVVGAGMVGAATSIQLLRDGHAVILIDPMQGTRSASFGNAGGLTPSSVTPLNVPGLLKRLPGLLINRRSPLYIRWRHLPRLTPWLVRFISHATPVRAAAMTDGINALINQCLEEHRALAAGTPAENLITESEFTVLYSNQRAFLADQYVWNERRRLGLQWRIVDGESLRQLEPELAGYGRFAVRMDEHGFIADPGKYLQALLEHFRSLGGKLMMGSVDQILTRGATARSVRVGGDQIAIDKVVVTAGIGSNALTKPLGLKIPMESQRGYHVELVEPSFMPKGVVNLSALGIFMTPMVGRLRCTSVVELAGYGPPENARIHSIMLEKIRGAFPQLRWQRVNCWMGHRPSLVDSLPVIGKAPGFDNIYLGYGHGHIGMMSGPRTGRLLADLIAGRQPNIDLRPFDAGRFS